MSTLQLLNLNGTFCLMM